MMQRFRRIKDEFGTTMLVRILVMLVLLPFMVALGWLGLETIWPAVIAVLGLVLGWLLRKQIVDNFEYLSWAMPATLFIYGIVLFVGEKFLGLTRVAQVMIITATTVIVFGIQFWSLSDPEIINTEKLSDDA